MQARHLSIIATAFFATSVAAPSIAADSAFSARELETIKAFYRDTQGPSGKRGGRSSLPPGIAKNLERGKALPPGLATQPLPATLAASLPPAPDGYERVVVDAKILLVETATRLIADVIADAILNQ